VFEGVPLQETVFEAHQKYVDLQFMLEGFEVFGLAHISELNVKDDYDSSRDLILYNAPGQFSKIRLLPGSFALFFPADSHLCRLKKDDQAYSGVKAVVKVPVSFFKI
jgi:biofilm protein TabA